MRESTAFIAAAASLEVLMRTLRSRRTQRTIAVASLDCERDDGSAGDDEIEIWGRARERDRLTWPASSGDSSVTADGCGGGEDARREAGA